MSSYVIDVSNPEKRKETNKSVENLLEEYEKISNEIGIYGSSVGAILFLSVIATICGFSFDVNLIIFLIVMFFLFFMLIKFDKTERRKIKELEEIKIKLLTSLKQEKIIVEHNKDEVYCSRDVIIYEAKNNNIFFVENKKIDAVKLLLENPNIQRIIKRKTFYDILKIHSKHQGIIHDLCKEKENTKVIYEN